MNNEVAAWISIADDPDALRHLIELCNQRLADLTGAQEAAGGVAAQSSLPVRQTQFENAGVLARPMTGPGPAPFHMDQLRAQINSQAQAAAIENARQASAEQRAKAEELNEEESGENQEPKPTPPPQNRQGQAGQRQQQGAQRQQQGQRQQQRPAQQR